ncbi:hypothetical protein JCM10450v2_002366 [Rhodotorula kratochvilovae]
MARKKAAPTAQPRAPIKAAPHAAAAAPSSPPADPLVFAHYLPRVPLQLFAAAFALVAAATPQGKHLPALDRVVAALVHDPLGTLPFVCAALAAIQTWFGYWARTCRINAQRVAEGKGKPVEPPKPRERKSFRGSLGAVWNNAFGGEAPAQALWKKQAQAKSAVAGLDTSFVPQAVSVTLAGAFAIHVCAVLLGAPLTANTTSTFLLSLLVSILAFLPLAIALPPSGTQERYIWLRLFSSLSTTTDLELALLAPALGALGGAWAGAIPIPLDWDRPWQQYPTTPVLGALAGHAVASLAVLAVVGYRRAVSAAVDVLAEAKATKGQ